MNNNVMNWIDRNESQVVELLQNLIRIPSVNPYFEEEEKFKFEYNAQVYLKHYLEDMGLRTEFTYPNPEELKKYKGLPGYYPDHKFTNRPNLYAEKLGVGNGKSILLTGHIDVVQRGSKWTKDPFSGMIEDGKIFGRGAVDMKGGVAAMIAATKAILESGVKLKGDIKIATVVDEEAGGMGTLALVDKGYRADGCIVTESTNSKIAPLCRGILWGEIIIDGRSGHIELPQADWRDGGAVDAIDKALLLMYQIENLNKEWALTKTHKYMALPCQIKFAQIEAGEYPTTYANKAIITFNAQYLPRERDKNGLGTNVKKEIESFIRAVSKTDSWLAENPPEINWLIDADCGETEDTDPFLIVTKDAADKIHKSVIEGIGFHTDMGWFDRVGIPTINFGPGDPRQAHQADEHIDINELIKSTKILAQVILDWCGVEESEEE